MLIQIKKGLRLPINGEPQQVIDQPLISTHTALLGDDYPGLKPELKIKIGEQIKRGQTLFADRRTGINYTAPASGIITEINRGLKRTLKSVIIRLEGDDAVDFQSYTRPQLAALSPDDIKINLLKTGLWPAFRTRPLGRNPDPATTPHSLFINVMDTRPLAADPDVIINAHADDFFDGLVVLSRLFEVNLYVCSKPGSKLLLPESGNIRQIEFSGPHPAGLVGTHIHHLDPVGQDKTVWHLDYQDVIAIGNTFRNGRLYSSRIIALGGPALRQPRLIPVTTGTALEEIVRSELKEGKHRVISGCVLSGRHGDPHTSFLSRYHLQVSVLDEYRPLAAKNGTGRKFSLYRLFLPWLTGSGRNYHFDTDVNGKTGPFIPLGGFERVMPLDILPTPLLRALLAKDFDTAIAMGCLELDEEDLALCEFVCCAKLEYTSPLRACLDFIDGASS